MKTIKHILFLAITMISLAGFSQVTVTLQVNGLVTDQQTQNPVANQAILVFVPDSIGGIFFYDSTFTGPDGLYVINFPVQYTPGTSTNFRVSTQDCNWLNHELYFTYTGNQTQYTADFSICHDSINPPIGCDNFIDINTIQSLSVNFYGWVVNGSAASYLWDFGDGNTATGQYTTHTFPQNGSYIVTLQTITDDSCMDLSERLIVLDDSLSNPCFSYFTVNETGIPFEMAFSGITLSPNPSTYQWQFGDGSSGSGENVVHTYCCLGTYTVQLTTSDSLGCTNVYTANIQVPDTLEYYTLTGQVFADSIPQNTGYATLYKADPNGTFVFHQLSYLYYGEYSFYSVVEGTYLIVASPFPDSTGMNPNMYLPTYYGDVIMWDEATQITLGEPQNPYNIHLVKYDSIGAGDGAVAGQLLSGGKSLSTANQLVYLLDADNTPARVAYTNASGNFTFSSVPFGSYKVHPAITGMITIASEIELDQNNPTANVVMTMDGNTILGVNEPVNSVFANIYPNPAVNTIYLTLKQAFNSFVQVYNSNGALVFENDYSTNQIQIDINAFKPGIYFVNLIEPNGNTSTRRFIKQ